MVGWRNFLAEHRDRIFAEYLELLRIPSIATRPENAADVARAGQWVARRLQACGLERVEILPTAGHPVVTGEWLHAPGQPTILLYGHYDVQPPDPLDLWESPPFEPTVRDGRVYARGASDMKGDLVAMIAGVEAILKTTGALPVNIKFFIEGSEEIGSIGMPELLAANRERFAGDLVVSADSGQWSEDQPMITHTWRGNVGAEIDLKGANSDLHSGVYGGAVQNALHAMVALLSSMRGSDGKILVEGFYDNVVQLSDEERARIAAVPFDVDAYKRALGVDDLFGEAGYTPAEQLGTRPTLEINGLWGGYQGEGRLMVLPNAAHAKISFRLVSNQDPDRILDLLERHVAQHCPPGVRATVTRGKNKARAYVLPVEHWGIQAVRDVLATLYGKDPYFTRFGASGGFLDMFLAGLGVHTVPFGFFLNDEQFHAPNEFFRLASFERAQAGYALLLERLRKR